MNFNSYIPLLQVSLAAHFLLFFSREVRDLICGYVFSLGIEEQKEQFKREVKEIKSILASDEFINDDELNSFCIVSSRHKRKFVKIEKKLNRLREKSIAENLNWIRGINSFLFVNTCFCVSTASLSKPSSAVFYFTCLSLFASLAVTWLSCRVLFMAKFNKDEEKKVHFRVYISLIYFCFVLFYCLFINPLVPEVISQCAIFLSKLGIGVHILILFNAFLCLFPLILIYAARKSLFPVRKADNSIVILTDELEKIKTLKESIKKKSVTTEYLSVK